MTNIVVIGTSGNEVSVRAKPGQTIMEVIRDAGFDELLSLCGGCCSCATCHVYVDLEFADRLGEMTSDEDDLLDSSSKRDGRSRLSCQLPVTPELEGLRVTIAPED
ncbi:ferredoxin [Novosphingobium endophyticum]|uniref:Ferredoxin n=1 Tax=Novosphingobium endophyticum TaxID=1955250 RepID=A0A916TUT0_9SPHN|nr:2Fe-2S iron-sulfur cluster-binding protein [Novosphingobium endophyticum]GGC00876.1 ferredoxin [Novosphingobium endophyticum]